jgi:glutathione S-transferase
MKLYIGNKRYSSWSLRPWLVLKHFHLSFTEVLIPLDMPQTTAQITAISPTARLPILVDDGLVIAESIAICEYLAEKFPDKKLWPWHAKDRALARAAAHEMHAGFGALRENCSMKTLERFPGFRASDAALKDIKRIDQLWREALERSGGPFLFGDFSIADAMFAPVALRVQTYELPLTGTSRSYSNGLLELPAMKEWAIGAQEETHRARRYETKPD